MRSTCPTPGKSRLRNGKRSSVIRYGKKGADSGQDGNLPEAAERKNMHHYTVETKRLLLRPLTAEKARLKSVESETEGFLRI